MDKQTKESAELLDILEHEEPKPNTEKQAEEVPKEQINTCTER